MKPQLSDNYRMKPPTIKPKNAKQPWHLPAIGTRNWNGSRIVMASGQQNSVDSRGTQYARLPSGQIVRGKKGGNEHS